MTAQGKRNERGGGAGGGSMLSTQGSGGRTSPRVMGEDWQGTEQRRERKCRGKERKSEGTRWLSKRF